VDPYGQALSTDKLKVGRRIIVDQRHLPMRFLLALDRWHGLDRWYAWGRDSSSRRRSRLSCLSRSWYGCHDPRLSWTSWLSRSRCGCPEPSRARPSRHLHECRAKGHCLLSYLFATDRLVTLPLDLMRVRIRLWR
jgi:hypothetical protein